MNIQDRVFIVDGASIYDMPIKNSIAIYKGEIVALRASIATVKIEIDTEPVGYIIKDIKVDYLSTTPQQALELASRTITTKDIRDESIQQG